MTRCILFALLFAAACAHAQEAPQSGSTRTPPRALNHPAAEYTEEARKLHISGAVTLKLHIDETGTVTSVEVILGLGHGLDESATEAAKRMKFLPPTEEGVPVAADIEVQIGFQQRTRVTKTVQRKN